MSEGSEQPRAQPGGGAVPPEPITDWLAFGNEFTRVAVRLVRTRNGERLEVHSRKLGTRVLLDPLEVESLTWQTPETFSRLLEDPYGPEDVRAAPLSRLLADEAAGTTSDALGGDDG